MYNNYPYMSPQPQFTQYNSQSMGLKGRPVSSIEEVRAAQIDFDGSLFVFPDVANKRVYTKQINLDGTASMKIYTLVENTLPTPSYVTKEEFDSTIEALKESLTKVKEQDNGSKSKASGGNASISF